MSATVKKKLLNIPVEEMERAIKRYCDYVKSKDYLDYQNGSTFFRSGYEDYLDKEEGANAKQRKSTADQYREFLT